MAILLALAWMWTAASRPRIRVEPSPATLAARRLHTLPRPSTATVIITLSGVLVFATLVTLLVRWSRSRSPSEGVPADAADSSRWETHRSRRADVLGGNHARRPHAPAHAGDPAISR